jgi:transcription termination/antitermination protein NusG
MAIEQLTAFEHEEWYALFVKTGSERAIQGKLKYLDFDELSFHVPCREMRIRSNGKWVMDLQPMFPGYILAKGRITNSSYSKVRQLNDVYTWICDEGGPLHIHPEEVALLRLLTDTDDVIRLSRVMYEGQRISVVDGPLKGLEAIIRKVDRRKGRVKIALSVFGNEKLVDISVEDVEGIGNKESDVG